MAQGGQFSRNLQWALNEHNYRIWKNNIQTGDSVIFHSTRKSEFSNAVKSSIIGFGYVGESLSIKNDFWWIQEIRDGSNYWPYVVPLKEIYLFSDTKNIDFKTPIQNKTNKEILDEIKVITADALEISNLNDKAKKIDPTMPNFPVNGSASRINKVYENLILPLNRNLFSLLEIGEDNILDKKLADKIDDKLSSISIEEIFKQAKEFDNGNKPSHAFRVGDIKVRIENQKQKRRVAKIEDYTCQVCQFKYEYLKSNGKTGWIIHVDHITDKAFEGNENLDNLWVLCPNCHTKKTYGVITVDKKLGKVFENGIEVMIKDNHLFI